ncbi:MULTISPECIES: MarR family winged helix-turn-helix transcriptional regulator [Alphaproteobacteria]|jgi:MarR family transcriptional regulator for hemolysin|uniref:MarR family winged helix-turn-helix transcriptional regulator n=1 Tax=Alphaproteobacteria TaxID=28211 RepID=UPI0003C55FB9|nr:MULTISPECIES: MarR family transcriptional regulator [Alphaproteobacteria]MCA0342175.1 MarR family transcriptional regulator [Pseudomonadota bacterium]EYR78055.1 transcription regulator,MarR family [Shinella sp. DD12]KNY18121.1 MarR family transcriptional regulator [Shinella sp. SUS2]KOC77317.1 MarR family transcriptional regulator [Shinella sp. GWS1]MCO5150555.1 MarR family transcriptional regulator [Shinella sp.]
MNTPDPRERILDDLSRVQRKMRALFDARVKERGLTLPRARALLILGRGVNLNQRELADELDIETPTLVRLLDGMEKQGFIQRQSVEGDRRAKQIAMTPRGAKVAGEVLELARSLRADVLKSISAQDMSTTVKVFAAMSDNIAQSCRECVEA